MTTGDSRPLSPRNESVYEIWSKAGSQSSSFDPALSPLHGQVGFIVGAPRSGTTWLQQLLVVHPLITTGGESHLFCEGLDGLFRNFANPDETSHLSTWVTEGELLTAVRQFCDALFSAQRVRTRPDATLIVEKTPNHRLQSRVQAQVYPDARYVHIVRDPRDSGASQRNLWGVRQEFASATGVAEKLVACVSDIRAHFGSLAYLELRYEDIVADTVGALEAIFDHLGVPSDRALCEAAAAFGRAPVNTAPRAVDVGPRNRRGDVLAERAAARVAGNLLVEFGYATEDEVARMRRQRSALTVAVDTRETTGRVYRAVRRRIRQRLAPHTAGWAANPDAERTTGTILTALAASDAQAIVSVLASRVRLDGEVATDAREVAARLVERFGGSRVTNKRGDGEFTQVVMVTPADARVVIRFEVRHGTTVAIDTRS